ncbi:putative RNA exonuclease pqe-1 [Anopheles aquasalis]|uniref:putative RNA exonuclease pqe-1 n=1 Tax=Anopheles aquasalis TaxID=42839 RepID=UPI00215A4D4B|nr:putative RNA exonuclease pqe-1 [Anopheles aquasalis]
MRLQQTWLMVAVVCGVLLAGYGADAQTRRLRVRPRVLVAPSSAEYSDSAEEAADDSRPQAQGAIPQYYRAQDRIGDSNAGGGGVGGQRLVLVAAGDDDEYNQYGSVQGGGRARAEQQYQRPAAKSTSAPTAPAARSKAAQSNESRAPPVQTIRNYSKVNDDGSFTFGYEAADGSFKEETRGTDCVVRGKYGYIDPDGNKREFTYVSGNPCDPNNPDGSEEEEAGGAERDGDGESGENVPQNYPQRRPVPPPPPPPVAARPTVRPVTAPTVPAPRPTTTVFQSDYSDRNRAEEQEVQIGQRGNGGRPAARPFGGVQQQPQPTLATVTQRPRPVQLVPTTPSSVSPTYHSPSPPPQTVVPVNITPKPVYRVSPQPTQPTLAPTTYRPAGGPAIGEFVGSTVSTRGPSNIDFEAEFKRFQQDNKVPVAGPGSPSSTSKPSPAPFGKAPGPATVVGVANGNPIYQSQLIFDPASGQYDTALYQQLPQSEGDFQLNHRIQPYVAAGPPHPAAGHLVSLEQLQQQSPLYRTAGPTASQPRPQQQQVQIPQQLYQKQQNELQFINSQQLFAQQLELQQSQLRADRLEAAKKVNGPPVPLHRFQPQPQPQPQPQQQQQQQQQQQYYFIQPQGPPHGGGGQIDAFLRGHNIDY